MEGHISLQTGDESQASEAAEMSTITTITPEKVSQAIEGIKREASASAIGGNTPASTTNNHHSSPDHNSKAKLEWMNRELDNLSSLVEIMKHCSESHVVNKVLQQILNRCKEIRKEWAPTSTQENHNNGCAQDKLSNNLSFRTKPAPPSTHNLEDQTKQQVFVARPLSKDQRQKALDACGSEEERKVEQDHQEWDDEIMKLQKTVDEKIARMHNKRTGKRVVSPFLSQEVKTRDSSSSIIASSARPSSEAEPSPSPISWRKSLPSPLDSPPASTSLEVPTSEPSTESTPSVKMVEQSDSPSECKIVPDQTKRKAPLSTSTSPGHPREEERSSSPKGSSSKGAIRKGSLGGSMLIFRSNRGMALQLVN